MKRLNTITSCLAICAGLFLFACGGSDSPEDICEDGVSTSCSKFVECGVFQDDAECRTMIDDDCSTNAGCDAGETFNQGPAEDCIDQIDAASCDDIADGSADLSACDMVCT